MKTFKRSKQLPDFKFSPIEDKANAESAPAKQPKRLTSRERRLSILNLKFIYFWINNIDKSPTPEQSSTPIQPGDKP